ncbi:MAG: transporter substrate-binding domain-containing protein [Chloroflexota bacterium]|nr:transporter substrate-binding domain-containing protein [Chloroflexota bacterium]
MVRKLSLASGLVLTGMVVLFSCSACGLQPQPDLATEIAAPLGEAERGITLHYFERFPYMEITQIGVAGLTASPAAQVFQTAGLPFHWQATPPKRQLYLLEQNQGQDCLLGWFKNPEREESGRFTLPIYQDHPYVALARLADDRIVSGGVVSTTLASPTLTLLVKEGFSYGSFLDAQIAEYHTPCVSTTVGSVEMLQMLQAGRADYFFIAPEEAAILLEDGSLQETAFKLVDFANMPPGEKRYLWCSKQVGESVIQQLNVAIQQCLTKTLWIE